MAQQTTHLGEKIKRVREMMGVKQDALAIELGDDWNQKKVSMLEAKAEIDPALLEQVANALKVPKEVIENFDTEKVFNVFSNHNTYNDASFIVNGTNNYAANDYLDKIIELHKEKEALFERMLKEKDEMIARLERMMENK
ncbi:helix-turn-helix transcriptional regulator [Danxiaibacter flavus]|uniref:Helix-turn-helix transcriptional regulator n=1 Tax=Danxiaibacter flavus TaxID=3049108 RepID=A0ABV3Z927_9BACT|nr:helix-turn-helix transcriptional regulator [Chitinophagaceae bacterium DXS]